MLSTSFALSQAVNDAMMDESVKASAGLLVSIHDSLDQDAFTKFLFEFSANLTAVTAGLVTQVFMTEDEIGKMISESNEIITNAMSDE